MKSSFTPPITDDKRFIEFVWDVNDAYNYSESKVDDNYNILVKVKNRTLLIPATDLYNRYEAFCQSNIIYEGWITRTVGYITSLVEKWSKVWS